MSQSELTPSSLAVADWCLPIASAGPSDVYVIFSKMQQKCRGIMPKSSWGKAFYKFILESNICIE